MEEKGAAVLKTKRYCSSTRDKKKVLRIVVPLTVRELAGVREDVAGVVAEVRVVRRHLLRRHQLVHGAAHVRVEVAAHLQFDERKGGSTNKVKHPVAKDLLLRSVR